MGRYCITSSVSGPLNLQAISVLCGLVYTFSAQISQGGEGAEENGWREEVGRNDAWVPVFLDLSSLSSRHRGGGLGSCAWNPG